MNSGPLIDYLRREIVNGEIPNFAEIKELFLVDNEQNIDQLIYWYENVVALKYLEIYLKRPSIREIILLGDGRVMLDEGNGLEIISPISLKKADLQLSLDILATKNKLFWNYKDPFISFGLDIFDQKVRVSLLHYSITVRGVSRAFFRKLQIREITFQDFGLDPQQVALMSQMVKEKKNILVAGATSSGKTTLMNLLLKQITHKEHLVILEDTHELELKSSDATHLISSNDLQGQTLKDYCNYALRMRPDRIILGEIRADEVVPFVLAMNTGHQGSISSLHANSAFEVFDRLATLFSLYADYKDIRYNDIKRIIKRSVDYIIYLKNQMVEEIYSLEKEHRCS